MLLVSAIQSGLQQIGDEFRRSRGCGVVQDGVLVLAGEIDGNPAFHHGADDIRLALAGEAVNRVVAVLQLGVDVPDLEALDEQIKDFPRAGQIQGPVGHDIPLLPREGALSQNLPDERDVPGLGGPVKAGHGVVVHVDQRLSEAQDPVDQGPVSCLHGGVEDALAGIGAGLEVGPSLHENVDDLPMAERESPEEGRLPMLAFLLQAGASVDEAHHIGQGAGFDGFHQG
jgi:hypothetical protein